MLKMAMEEIFLLKSGKALRADKKILILLRKKRKRLIKKMLK